MSKLSPNAACLCRSGAKYKRCCRPLHQGGAPTTAEALMRSRFSAYALGLVDYVLATTHPDGPNWEDDRAEWAAGVAAFSRSTSFDGLEILSSGEGEREAFVTFRATLSQEGRDASFTERNRFLREDGRWLYHSGEPR